MAVYRITDWNEHFENNRTRELKHMQWVPITNKQDGDGYTELVEHKDGAAHLGAWLAIVQIASKCDPRGTLLRDNGKPHDIKSISRMSRISKKIIGEAIERLSGQEIGWMQVVETDGDTENVVTIPQEGAGMSQEPAQNGREGNGKKKEGNERRDLFLGNEMPECLNTVEFFQAWGQWVQHRKEVKKPLTPTSVSRQLSSLAKSGHGMAIKTINHSIKNGWLGLFEPTGKTVDKGEKTYR